MFLRPYQQRAITRASEVYRQGARAICIVAPTGAGKTAIGVEIAIRAARTARPLWLAHTVELVDQARAKLPPGTEVATIQGLTASGRRPPAGIVVLDEAHHFAADQWGAVASDYRGVPIIGLTATPERADGRPLGDLFQALVVAATYSELLAGGWIVPCDVFAPDKRRGTLALSPSTAALRFSRGTPAIVFTRTVSEALEAASAIPGARAIHADTPADERRAAVDGFRAGAIPALVSVSVLSEGFDAPNATTCILAVGCGHPSVYLQKVGRVLRPAPGKSRAILVDLCGSYHDHGSPTDDREYSLEGAAIRRAGAAPVVWQCKDCGMCLVNPPSNRVCPSCGGIMPVPEAIRVAERRVELQQQRAGHDDDRRRKEWCGLVAQAKARGYKSGWAYFKFRARYGCEPPRSDE